MFAQFKGKNVDLYNDNRSIIRRLRVANDVVNVQVNGNGLKATIAITMKNGKTVLYKANGQVIRP